MSSVICRGAGLVFVVTVLACGKTTSNEGAVESDSSAGGSASSTQGNGVGGVAATTSDAVSTSDTGGTPGASTGASGSDGGGSTATGGTGGYSTNGTGGAGSGGLGGSSGGAAGEPGTGGTGSLVPSCHAFPRIFAARSCLDCQLTADRTCEVYLWEAETTCGLSFACFRRHCALSCFDDCEQDSCACLDSCLPIGPSACRDAFATLMDCYAGFCGDCW